MYGSIELGGTKIRCAIIDDDISIIDEIRIKTTTPLEDIKDISKFFKGMNIKSLGVGSFGPIDINKDSRTYGYIKNTPKLAYKDFDLLGNLKKNLNLPIGLSTDVGASGIGEYEMGAASGKKSSLYITIGTGVGASFIQDGVLLEGFSHPEMGHIEIVREDGDEVKSICPYHKSCLEGLVSGPALEYRTGMKGQDVDIDDPAIDIIAKYIAKGLLNFTVILRPDIIIIGGGVANKEGMIEKIRNQLDKLDPHYIARPASEDYIVFPKLGNEAGLYGGYFLAKNAGRDSIN